MTSILWGGSTSDPSCRGAPLCFHAWPGAPRFGVVDEDTKIVSLGRKKKTKVPNSRKIRATEGNKVGHDSLSQIFQTHNWPTGCVTKVPV